MTCKYKFKSGKKKNTECGKEGCKTKTHMKFVEEVVVKNFKEVPGELSILDYAFLIKNELDFIISNKKPTNIIFKNTEKRCIVNEKVNTSYETQCYIMYKYKLLSNNIVDEFERIIEPINKYHELDELLKILTDLQFISLFAGIKNKI